MNYTEIGNVKIEKTAALAPMAGKCAVVQRGCAGAEVDRLSRQHKRKRKGRE